jgi:hypothetical protein
VFEDSIVCPDMLRTMSPGCGAAARQVPQAGMTPTMLSGSHHRAV